MRTDIALNKSPKFPGQGPFSRIYDWLEGFGAAVRTRDFALGQTYFDAEVFSFGTRSVQMSGLDHLVNQQWIPIWNATRGFHLHLDTAVVGGHEQLAWAASTWQSQGQDAAGQWFDRFGRATFILKPGGHHWLAIHSHFSINPAVQTR